MRDLRSSLSMPRFSRWNRGPWFIPGQRENRYMRWKVPFSYYYLFIYCFVCCWFFGHVDVRETCFGPCVVVAAFAVLYDTVPSLVMRHHIPNPNSSSPLAVTTSATLISVSISAFLLAVRTNPATVLLSALAVVVEYMAFVCVCDEGRIYPP